MNWIFLEFGSKELKALRAQVESSSVQIEDFASWPVKDEYYEGLYFPTSQAWSALAVGLNELNWLSNSELVVGSALPSGYLETRYLRFPFSSDKKIEKVLPLELEGNIPFDLDEVLLKSRVIRGDGVRDYGKESQVLMMAYKKDLVEGFEKELRQFQISIPSISIEVLTLMSLRQCVPPEPVTGFLNIGQHKTDFLLVQRSGQVLGLRCFWWGAADMQEKLMQHLQVDSRRAEALFEQQASFEISKDSESIHVKMADALEESLSDFMNQFRQSLKGFQQSALEYPRPFPVYLVGEGSQIPGLRERLNERFQAEFEAAFDHLPIHTLFSQVRGLEALENPMKAIGTVCQALSQTRSHRTKILNFSQSSFQFQQNLQKIRSKGLGVLKKVAMLLIAPIIYMLVSYGIHSTEKETIRDQLANILRRNQYEFKQGDSIGQVKRDLQAQIIELRQKADAIREDHDSPLIILSELSRKIDRSLKIDVREFKVTDSKVLVEATTDDANTRDKILRKVQESYPTANSTKLESCSDFKGCKLFNIEFDRPLRTN